MSPPLSPTFYGHIASIQDALILFEACLNGSLNHIARRPHDRERAGLIKSGNIFIYEEHSSGIKRWTDGVPWSPSRTLGNFLVYRELDRPFPSGMKNSAMKRSKRSLGISKQAPYNEAGCVTATTQYLPPSQHWITVREFAKQGTRTVLDWVTCGLICIAFKEEGLVKKTVSVTVGAVSHHLISYYTIADVRNNKLGTPSKDQRFQDIHLRPDLVVPNRTFEDQLAKLNYDSNG